MKQLLISLALGISIATGTISTVQAEPATEPLTQAVARLEAEGYEVVESYRSWLGRLVVISIRDGIVRELVLNRATGAILSDRLFVARQPGAPRSTAPDSSQGNTDQGNTENTGAPGQKPHDKSSSSGGSGGNK